MWMPEVTTLERAEARFVVLENTGRISAGPMKP